MRQAAPRRRQKNFPLLAVQSTQKARTVIDRFLREGPREEVVRFRTLWKAALKRGARQTQQGKVTEEWKWLESLLLWDEYQNGNAQQALEALCQWLDLDGAFFLRQWWVSELLASWRKDQEWKKIERLFRGRRGKRQSQNKAEEYRRDQQIVAIVEKHLLHHSYREACKRASKELLSLGFTRISEEGVRRAYEKTPLILRERYTPIYVAVKTLLERGLTEKAAEKEVATNPKSYGISESLSPQLVHSIYGKYTKQFGRPGVKLRQRARRPSRGPKKRKATA